MNYLMIISHFFLLFVIALINTYLMYIISRNAFRDITKSFTERYLLKDAVYIEILNEYKTTIKKFTENHEKNSQYLHDIDLKLCNFRDKLNEMKNEIKEINRYLNE